MATSSASEEYLKVSSFKVTIDGHQWGSYDTVTGIGIDMEDIAYHEGKNQMLNRPGRFNARDISLSRPFKKDKELYAWMKDIKAGKQVRKSGSIILMDDSEKEVIRFNFFGAWPKTWSGPTFTKDAGGNEILREEVTLSVTDVELA